jgi:hypothetical protein
MNDEDMSYIYEEPVSLRASDWEAFCKKMREEVALHPGRRDAVEALQSAERSLKEIKETWAEIDAKAA